MKSNSGRAGSERSGYLRNRARSAIHQRRKVRVEMLPLIDVMFLLVAFFMITSLALVRQQGIPINLVPAETGDQSLVQSEQLVVSITAAGEFFLNKSRLDIVSLAEALRSLVDEKSSKLVVINADGAAQHSQVLMAVDAARQAGFVDIVFTVEPKE